MSLVDSTVSSTKYMCLVMWCHDHSIISARLPCDWPLIAWTNLPLPPNHPSRYATSLAHLWSPNPLKQYFQECRRDRSTDWSHGQVPHRIVMSPHCLPRQRCSSKPASCTCSSGHGGDATSGIDVPSNCVPHLFRPPCGISALSATLDASQWTSFPSRSEEAREDAMSKLYNQESHSILCPVRRPSLRVRLA